MRILVYGAGVQGCELAHHGYLQKREKHGDSAGAGRVEERSNRQPLTICPLGPAQKRAKWTVYADKLKRWPRRKL